LFCAISGDRILHEDDHILIIRDRYPVSPGHALVVPRRHVARWQETTPDERHAMLRGVDVAMAQIKERHSPDGFNIGINDGEAAGQTIFHLHLHVIPRYTGDVEDPRGGIRHVISTKADYWSR
jgi:diadenosine tetraphosphate (Ap4A) HIT family hydrolase